jgi:hypothetical protein
MPSVMSSTYLGTEAYCGLLFSPCKYVSAAARDSPVGVPLTGVAFE